MRQIDSLHSREVLKQTAYSPHVFQPVEQRYFDLRRQVVNYDI